MISCPTCHSFVTEHSAACPECGQSFCPSCAKPVDDGSPVCSYCGEELALHCAGCGRELSRSAAFCPECGLALNDAGPILVPEYTRIRKQSADGEDESYDGICPSCQSELFIEDGICHECGQSICTSCGEALDEGDDACPACGAKLFFACPLCDFELMVGTQMCPNCNALFPGVCSRCGTTVEANDTRCPSCRQLLSIQSRRSARTIRTFLVGRQLVRMVACPSCGRHMNPASGPCADCGSRVCDECQLVLFEDERICPRCGQRVKESTSWGGHRP